MMKKYYALLIVLGLLLAGCSAEEANSDETTPAYITATQELIAAAKTGDVARVKELSFTDGDARYWDDDIVIELRRYFTDYILKHLEYEIVSAERFDDQQSSTEYVDSKGVTHIFEGHAVVEIKINYADLQPFYGEHQALFNDFVEADAAGNSEKIVQLKQQLDDALNNYAHDKKTATNLLDLFLLDDEWKVVSQDYATLMYLLTSDYINQTE